MQYFLIILLAAVGLFCFLYPKIKKTVISTTNYSAKNDYHKLKKDIEDSIINEDEDYPMYNELYNMLQDYNNILIDTNQEELSGELPVKGSLLDTSAIFPIKTFGSVQIFGSLKKEKRRRKRRQKKQDKKNIFPIYFEAGRIELSSGFGLLPLTSVPLGYKPSMSVFYGYAKESLIYKTNFIIRKGDKIVVDTIFDTFTYIVDDMGALTEKDVDYMKMQNNKNEIMLLLFLPNKKDRYCIYASLEDDESEAIDETEDEIDDNDDN